MQVDALVIGGSFAGLTAAIYLARARRTVCVVDTRQPRNRFAAESHGFLGHDGADPRRMLATARDQVSAYPTARLIESEAVEARREGDGFIVSLARGDAVAAKVVVLAFGLADFLPDIPGLRERWGASVLHCPYCHGFEFSERPLGVLYRAPMSVHQALLVAEWGPTTLLLHGASLDSESLARLAARGVAVEPRRIRSLVGDGSALAAVELEDGRRALEALYIAPATRLASPLAEDLGAEVVDGPLGPMVATDPDRMTRVPGLYAAGDIARAPHSVGWAVADGITAGTAAHRALVFG